MARLQAASTGAQTRRTLRELTLAEAPSKAYAPAPAPYEIQDAVPGSVLLSMPADGIAKCCQNAESKGLSTSNENIASCLVDHDCYFKNNHDIPTELCLWTRNNEALLKSMLNCF